MADKITKEQRSRIMRAVKSKDSKMELSLRKGLNKNGLHYKKNVARLPGTPDIAFIDKKVVVFLDSCFWHGCRWHGTMPVSNRKFWFEKIQRNKERDKEVNFEYKKMGWKVLRFWGHEVKKNSEEAIKKIVESLNHKSK